MSSPISVATLFVAQTAETFLKIGLEVATMLGLPVTTWRTGDPTKSTYHFLAEVFGEKDKVFTEFVKAGFLSTAEAEWLELRASEVYGVAKPQASYATPSVSVVNDGGGFFTHNPGEAVFQNTITRKTYRNTNTVTLAGLGAVGTYELIADEAGSGSSVGVNEIDEMVTQADGVRITGSTVGLANDAATDPELRSLCAESLGALSPNGPWDAYAFVAKNPKKFGGVDVGVNRATPHPSTNGTATLVIATRSGAADAAAVAATQTLVELWATPLTVNPVVVSAVALSTARTLTIYKKSTLTKSATEISAAALSAIDKLFSEVPIGGNGGVVAESKMNEVIHALFPEQIDKVVGATEITLATNQVPVRGTWGVNVLG